MIRTILYAILFFGIDQLSKWLILEWIDLDQVGVYEVFDPYLIFSMGWNKGFNFGLLSGYPTVSLWLGVTLAVVISLMLLNLARQFQGRFAPFLIGMIVGGALGNAIDRVRFGAVVDFLNMSCCGVQNPYVFNIADVFVFVGLIGLVLFWDRFAKRA